MKPTLVILPGWGGSHETWAGFSHLAKDDFEVVVIDLPCFGKEPCPPQAWGVEEYAEFVKSKLLKLNSNSIVLGHSFGGQVATYLTAHSPELVEKLILVAAAVIRPKKTLKRRVFQSIATNGKIFFSLPGMRRFEKISKKLLYKIIDSPDYESTDGIKRSIYQKIIRADLRHLLPEIQTETLILWGKKDRMTPLWQGKKIAQLLPNAKIKILEKGRHGLHHPMSAPQLLEYIKEFAIYI